eukprot:m.267577 g.267577  ORF g.267577 m.267577 type:complete len:348 (+) comp33664_c0_seq1:136-1179(+)
MLPKPVARLLGVVAAAAAILALFYYHQRSLQHTASTPPIPLPDGPLAPPVAPDPNPLYSGVLAGPTKKLCIDNGFRSSGAPVLYPCHDAIQQRWLLHHKGFLQSAVLENNPVCLLAHHVVLTDCHDASSWVIDGDRIRVGRNLCLGRSQSFPVVGPCDGSAAQRWHGFDTEPSTLTDAHGQICLDTMQKDRGHIGMYACHSGGSQQWGYAENGKIFVANTPDACLSLKFGLAQAPCVEDDMFRWRYDAHSGKLKPFLQSSRCLDHSEEGAGHLRLTSCFEDNNAQKFIFFAPQPEPEKPAAPAAAAAAAPAPVEKKQSSAAEAIPPKNQEGSEQEGKQTEPKKEQSA